MRNSETNSFDKKNVSAAIKQNLELMKQIEDRENQVKKLTEDVNSRAQKENRVELNNA